MSHPGVFAQRRCGVGSTCFFEHVTANCEVEFPTLKNLTTHDMRVIEEIVSTVSGDVSVAERASAVRAVLGHYSQGELDFIIENNTHSYDRAQALRTSRLDPCARPFSSAENILERHTRESEATIAAARSAHRCAPRGAREQHTHSYDRAQALRTSRLDPRARLFSSAENILERHTRESEATIAAARPAHRCAPRGASPDAPLAAPSAVPPAAPAFARVHADTDPLKGDGSAKKRTYFDRVTKGALVISENFSGGETSFASRTRKDRRSTRRRRRRRGSHSRSGTSRKSRHSGAATSPPERAPQLPPF